MTPLKNYILNTPETDSKPGITEKILAINNPMQYHQSLSGYMETPLHRLENLSEKYGVGGIFVKDESHRYGLKSFKALGALFAIDRLIKDSDAITELVTATDGNHGKAVARAAKESGKCCTVFVPDHTSRTRIDSIKGEGAKVIEVKGNYDIACSFALEESKKTGKALIQDTAYIDYEEVPALIMAGYTTMFREMENSLNLPGKPLVDVVFLQAGVGSFAAGAIWYYRTRYGADSPKFVIVEPVQADGIFESFLQNKHSASRGNFKTIMAGLNCGLPSLSAWEIIYNGASASIRIDEDICRRAIRELYFPGGDDHRIVSGESGCAGLAGLISVLEKTKMREVKKHLGLSETSRVLIINTEGDTDPESFNQIIG